MYILGKRADTLDATDIKRLVDGKVQENKTLDYKKELKINQDKEKKEFLFDISAMSNTEGGCLIYGIEESKDEKGQNTGTPESIVGILIDNYDKLTQQIEDIIKGNTEPSISNIALNSLIVDDKKILVIGISKALGLPTMVTFNKTNKFYRRRNSGNYPVDVFELNQMFMQNQVLKESAEKFRFQRIDKVRAGKVFPSIAISTSFFIHIIPFSFQNEQSLDLTNIAQMGITTKMMPMNLSGCDTMYNIDGFATWNGMGKPQITSYVQLFRNGIYEIYTSDLFEQRPIKGKTLLCMYGENFIPEVLKKIDGGLAVLKSFQVESPFIISISLVGMKGGVIFSTPKWGRPFLVDEIYLPPIIIPTYETDIYKQLKSNFDIIWQAAGENQSPTYSPNH